MSSRAFLAGSRAALRLVASERVAARWDEASVLAGMSVGELAAHLARAVLQVQAYRGAPVPAGVAPLDAAGYYAGLEGAAEPSSALNTGVRERAAATAADGHDALVASLRAAVDDLAAALPDAAADEVLAVGHRRDQVLGVGEYLRTRCVELAVHLEDLALSLGCEPGAPPSTVAVAVEVLQEAARRRHGDAAVLRALARRERDALDAARVL
ncbi:maleylpyruvate isomerase N-terminal domain-containing protein [Aquipuribacter sp. SD81]|uniref:maleylpyruvate isomerase N-terminal domain-containing protein n=1 Tax=Aquipuribacter sp. SD81 TaxID=3127703 RepID=UPI003018F1C7